MTRAKIAIVGTGWWTTQTHIPALQQNPDAEIVALCDLDQDRLKTASDAFGINRTYTRLGDMLSNEKIDAVIVATNHATHYTIAHQCIMNDLPVLIEKPMTLKAQEARELVKLARSRGVALRVGYNHNHTSYTRRSREVIQSGALGKVQFISGIFSQNIIGFLRGNPPPREGMLVNPGDVYTDPQRSGGGFGYLQLTHLAGMIFFITGLRSQRVFALMQKHDLTVDMINAVNAQLEDDVLVSIGGTANLGGPWRKIDLQIFCERGWIDIDEAQGTAVIQGSDIETESYQLRGNWQQRYPYSAPVDDLVDVVLGRQREGVPGEVGCLAVELIEAAYRSAAMNGVGIEISSLYDEHEADQTL